MVFSWTWQETSHDTYGTGESWLNVNLSAAFIIVVSEIESDIIYLFCRLFDRQGHGSSGI